MPKKKLKPPKITQTKAELRLLEIASETLKENKQIDFKEAFDPTSAPEWCQILKDIIAMSNSGGGVILFGVKDDGNAVEDFDNASILNIDPATIADKVYSYTNENFSEIKIAQVARKDGTVPIFLIEAAPTPIVFVKPGADVSEKGKQRPAFVKGSVYFRHGAKSEPGNTNDIKQALDRAINRTKKNWFEGVRKISNIKDSDEIIVKKSTEQDQPKTIRQVPGRIVSDSAAPSFRPDNAADLWPHRSKELTNKVNASLPEGKKISNHDLLSIKSKFKIDEKTKPDLVYKPYKDVSPRYSDDFVKWILDSFLENPNFFEEAKAHYKEKKTKL